MPSDDRERTYENALATHLRAGSHAAPPSNPCADSEMLAAYHEGSLPPEQIASLKTHVTTCSRCQEILTLLEATDQIPAALADDQRVAAALAAAKSKVEVLPARKPTRWLWLAPAGALAAALLAWVAVQQTNLVRLAKQAPAIANKQTEIAKAQTTSPAPLSGPSLDATRKAEAAPLEAFSDLQAVSPSQIDPALKRRSRSPAKEKDSLSARNGIPAGSVNGLAGGVGGTAPRPVTPPASPQSLQSIAPRAATESVTVEAANANELAQTKTDALQPGLEEKSANQKRSAVTFRAMAPASPAAGAPPPAPAKSSEPSQLNTESAVLANQPVEQRDFTNLTATGAAAGLRLANAGVAMVNVSAPGGRVSWRIGSAGVIEFSSNAGKTWIVQPSGTIADLLAGSAPSAKICWIVGRSGTILRTTDGGKHWQKVNPPAQDDFRSVFAVDAHQVTAFVSNASYQSKDGGATWTKLPLE